MAIGEHYTPHIHSVPGITLAKFAAGIKKSGADDLVIICCEEGTRAAAVFTKNIFCAAPVIIAREHLSMSMPRVLIVNSGNANAGTGKQGHKDAQHICSSLAKKLGIQTHEVLPFSTGVIGQRLPISKFDAFFELDFQNALKTDNWLDAANGIMTTDTRNKVASVAFVVDGHEIVVTGIAKGAGMIKPDMATMLSFIATNAKVEPAILQRILKNAVNRSFNRITIDGDTSTNDACVLLATGKTDAPVVDTENEELYIEFSNAVETVCLELAQAIVRDGEGATKFVTVSVLGGNSSEECLEVAYTVAHSPLIKTALFASDPNWGRILAAVGRAKIENLDIEALQIYLGNVCIVEDGGAADSYTEEQGQAVMNAEEIQITIHLNRGAVKETVWTCDLSHDYVKINAEYRS